MNESSAQLRDELKHSGFPLFLRLEVDESLGWSLSRPHPCAGSTLAVREASRPPGSFSTTQNSQSFDVPILGLTLHEKCPTYVCVCELIHAEA